MESNNNETVYNLTKAACKARATGDSRLANMLRDKALWIASVSRQGADR